MRTNPFSEIKLDSSITSLEEFNELLGEIESVAAFDDLNIAGGRNLIVKSGGSVFRIGKRKLQGSEVEGIANLIGKGSNVSSDVYGGNQLDPGYQFTFKERKVFRYRVNISSIRDGGGQQIKIAMRAIKSEIPSINYVSLKEEDCKAILNGGGLVIISGETGSGKTTTLAAIIGYVIKSGLYSKVVCCYEEPTEFIYQPLIDEMIEKNGECGVEVYQHEIGHDLTTFIEGTRNAFRSNPDIILLGEAREYETIEASMLLAQSGHLVFITTHAKGVINTISRLVSSFPAEKQDSARMSFMTATKAIISQELLVKSDKSRIPIREELFIHESIQREFGRSSVNDLSSKFADYFNNKGVTFAQYANALYEEGRLSEQDLNVIMQRES